MTIWEILIIGPLAIILVITIIAALIGFSLLIVGLPIFLVNLYKNHKNQDKISLWEILEETYF